MTTTQKLIISGAAAALILYLMRPRVTSVAASPAQSFSALIAAGDRDYGAKKFASAHSLYKAAYAAASDKAQKVRALGSLVVSSQDVGSYTDFSNYIAQLKQIDPGNAWLAARGEA